MYRKFILVPLFIVSYLITRAQLQPADSCLDAYFHRLYGYRTVATLSSITETFDNKLLWCGSASRTNTSISADGDAVIAKLRNNGTVIWSKAIGGADLSGKATYIKSIRGMEGLPVEQSVTNACYFYNRTGELLATGNQYSRLYIKGHH
jgi:hypothetical protein